VQLVVDDKKIDDFDVVVSIVVVALV